MNPLFTGLYRLHQRIFSHMKTPTEGKTTSYRFIIFIQANGTAEKGGDSMERG